MSGFNIMRFVYIILFSAFWFIPAFSQGPDLLNTAADAAYMKDSEKAMIREINLLRSNPKGYLVYIDQYVAETKKNPEKIGSGQMRYSLTFNYELVNYLDLQGMLHLAEAIVEGALARMESRGSHFRTDYPDRDDRHWLRHTLVFKTREGLRLEYKDVNIANYPPEKRTY